MVARARGGGPMIWLIPLGIALTSNLDNLGAGAAIGAQGRRIAAVPNLVIALITALVTWCAMSVGTSITREVPGSVLKVLGALALIAIGLVPLVALIRRTPPPAPAPAPEVPRRPGRLRSVLVVLTRSWRERAALRRGNEVSLAQAGVLGVALSLNNLATGVAAGVAGVSTLLTTLDAAVLSFVLVALGARLGARVAQRVSGRASTALGGVLLVGVGVAALVAH